MRHHGFLALALAGTAAATCWLIHDNDQLDASEDRRPSFREVFANQTPAAPPEQDPNGVRLNYFDARWNKVLRDVAEQAQLNLVMEKVPAGRYARRDRNRYEVESALNILNRELEPQGFRLIQQNGFLIVLELEKARTRYARPTVPATPSSAYPRPSAATSSPVDRAAASNPFHAVSRRSDDPSTMTPWTQVARQDDVPPPVDAAQDAFQNDYEPVREFGQTVTRPQKRAEQPPVDNGPLVVRKVQINHSKAADLARTIYLVFESRAELVKEGLQGLPTFVVNPANTNVQGVRPVFRIGISQASNELLIEATENRVSHLLRLISELDQPLDEGDDDQTVELVPNEGIDEATAKQLNEQIHRLVALQAQQNGQPQNNQQQPVDGGQDDLQSGDSINLRGDVTIQAIPDIGVIIIKGNQADVERVRALINQLEEMSIGSLPSIHLLNLRNVNSEAMSELLTSVYDRLAELRQRGNQERQTVAFFPVVQPNSILILAPQIELDSILELASQLDQKVAPESEFKVFELKNAIASQVLAALESLYETEEGRGLRTRIQSFADVRTNSVIVQGSPADLAEVAELISRIDRDAPGKVHRVQIFQLHHATAEALAEVINTAIQAVSSPPQQAAGGGGFGGFGGGTNQAPQELRDGTSVALEFLTSDGNTERLVKSGILADVRITADPRSNTLVVSAPEASMMLMAALIAELDGAPSATASIKVFTLKNADAEQSVELLTSLFENQNQEEQLGVQIAGAEDATTSLIPLQFSADIRSNTVLAIGSEEALEVVEAILLRLDSDDTRQRRTDVIQLRNAPAELVSQSIQDFLAQQQALQDSTADLLSNIERIRQEVLIAPDTNSNSLIVSASPDYYSQIVEIIEELDATPPQVVISALIVEVNLDNTDEFGVELGFQDPLLFTRSVVTDAANNLVTIPTVTNVPGVGQVQSTTIVSQSGTPGLNFNNTSAALGNNVAGTPGIVGTQGLSNFSLGRQNGDLGFGGFVFSAQSDAVSVLIRALAARRTVHVLSRPQIRTTHNNIARMEVGQQVPIVNGVNQTVTAITPTIVQQNVGIILEVTPRITPDGSVAMVVYAEKSAVAPGTIPVFTDLTTGNTINSVIINTAIADTTVNVPNGQTIVIGGMITKTDDTLERKVPWLGDLPIVGKAFRYDGTTTNRTELLIFLTPRIVFNDIDSELIKQVEAERLHFIESEAEEIHGPLYSVPPSGLQQFDQYPGEGYGVPGEVYPMDGGVMPSPEPYLPPPGVNEFPPQSGRGRADDPQSPTLQNLSVGTTPRSSGLPTERAEPIIRPATATRQLAEGAVSEKTTRPISFSSEDTEFEEETDPDQAEQAARDGWMRRMLKRRK